MTGDGLDEQELVRALRAPGSPAELAGEETYRALFREHGPGSAGGPDQPRPRPRRTAVRRIGTSATLAAVVAVTTAGVAAAYSSHLPDPLQSAVHRVLAPIGVPPAAPRRAVERPAGRTVETAPPATQTPDVLESPTPSHPTPSGTPTHAPSRAPRASTTPRPAATPTPTPTASPSPTPTSPPPTSPAPTPPRPVPASVSIVASTGHRVAPGQMTVFQGTVTAADGTPVPHVRVVLHQHTDGGWVRVADGRTDSDGSVSLTSPPAERTTTLRLTARKVRSEPWRLTLQPSLSVSAETDGDVARVHVQASGGQPGDEVRLLAWRDGQFVTVATGTLDGSGGAVLETQAPKKRRTVVVRLLPTPDHDGARAKVAVAPVSRSR